MKPDLEIGRLCKSIQDSRRSLQRYRENRLEMVRQYVGNHWSEEGSGKQVPLNLIATYVQIVGRHLIAKNPRVMLSTFNRQYKPTVNALQQWANQNIEKQRLADKLRRIVHDALFSIGIAKVSIGNAGDAAMSGWEIKAGEPVIQRVDLDDFFFDVNARTIEESAFIGHRYRIPLEVASKMLGKKAKDLQATEDKDYNEHGDERINVMGRGTGSTDEFEDMVDLWEVYLPRHRRVLTLSDGCVTAMGETDGEPLLDQPWIGPYCGPYHILAYGIVPGNAMPKGPVQDLLDLHIAVNSTLRKIMRTTDRMKEVGLVEGQASEDGNRVINANDGEIIKVQNPKGIGQMVFSGQHIAPLHAMAISFKDLFSFMGGNLELLGGRSPQAKTATQDKMLNENASVGIADMQDTTLTFVSKMLESWLWFQHHDPYTIQRVSHPVKGRAGKDIERVIYPNAPEYTDPDDKNFKGRPLHVRDIPFEQLEMRVDPYSMQHHTPQSRLAFLTQTVTQLIAPVLPLLQQQGIMLDMNTFLRKLGEFADTPDIDEVLTIMEPPQGSPVGSGHGDQPKMPTSTNREYTRHNVSEQTSDSANRNMVSGLLGMNSGGGRETAKSGAPA